MMRLVCIWTLCIALSGCYKDEVDLPALTTNPFDPDYTGESVFVFDSTYASTVTIGFPPLPTVVQTVQLHLRGDLLPAGTVTSVRFMDPEASEPVIVPPVPGTYIYRFQRNVVEPFVERCYSVALSNAFSEGRAETICCTLQ
ncbi:MAG: hypothetical protein ABI432_04260 [Flavobacteriales bacterium]